eukprot:m.9126 g.9126  ORF g.9126 m.9126 type:complete len:807 (+) comp4012_c0_seq2:204-2624(+)
MKSQTILLLLCLPSIMAKEAPKWPWFDPTLSFEERTKMLVANMTNDELISQMVKFSPPIERLGVPGFSYHMEAAHGVATGGDSTVFPSSVARAASFNLDLEEKIGVTIGIEARAKWNEYISLHGGPPPYNAEGLALTLYAPEMNLCRDPRWGRCQESRGEDPFLTSKFTVAFVKAVQTKKDKYLLTTGMLKDFVVYNVESNQPVGGDNWQFRLQYNAIVSDADLRMSFLPAFKAGILEANVSSVMTSYHALNGIPETAHPILKQILRKEFNWNGAIVSDGGAVSYILQFNYLNLSMTDNITAAAAAAVNAGVDMNSGGFMRKDNPANCSGCIPNMTGFAYAHLGTAMRQGMVERSTLIPSVQRLMMMRMQLGLFDPPQMVPFSKLGASDVDTEESRALARQSAVESLVLLHNNGQLPLSSSAISKLAIIGPNANNTMPLLSDYNGCSLRKYINSNDPSPSCTLVTPLMAAYMTLPKAKIEYQEGCKVNSTNTSGIASAVLAAKNADVALLVLGLESGDLNNKKIEGEAHDRSSLSLPGVQLELAQAVIAAQPNTIVVIVSGGAVSEPSIMMGSHSLLNNASDTAKTNPMAVIYQFYPGEMGGPALFDTVFGNASFSGRLPVTIVKSLDQLPPYLIQNMSHTPGRTYRYLTQDPMYSFGYGMSYFSFEYSDLKVTPPPSGAASQGNVTIAVTLTNSRAVPGTHLKSGDEVVQVYVEYIGDNGEENVAYPLRELKAFRRVSLDLQAPQTVHMEIPVQDLALYKDGRMQVLPGQYKIHVGGASPATPSDLLAPTREWGPHEPLSKIISL